jgi:predicted nucleotidyltransferase
MEQASLDVGPFLAAVAAWAAARGDIAAVALVGSHARGAATAESDIDLVVLTPDAAKYLNDHSWATAFGAVERASVEDYGAVTSLRVHFADGLETEFGFAAPDWAQPPLDAGTAEVVRGGLRALYDPHGLLAELASPPIESGG